MSYRVVQSEQEILWASPNNQSVLIKTTYQWAFPQLQGKDSPKQFLKDINQLDRQPGEYQHS